MRALHTINRVTCKQLTVRVRENHLRQHLLSTTNHPPLYTFPQFSSVEYYSVAYNVCCVYASLVRFSEWCGTTPGSVSTFSYFWPAVEYNVKRVQAAFGTTTRPRFTQHPIQQWQAIHSRVGRTHDVKPRWWCRSALIFESFPYYCGHDTFVRSCGLALWVFSLLTIERTPASLLTL